MGRRRGRHGAAVVALVMVGLLMVTPGLQANEFQLLLKCRAGVDVDINHGPSVSADAGCGVDGDELTYVGAGTVVTAVGTGLTDDGLVVCNSNGPSAGGFCVPNSASAIEVKDELVGRDVSFQVCADMNADGDCTDTSLATNPDEVLFSHELNAPETYRNPMDISALSNPPTSSFNPDGKYVVFICAGVHDNGGSVHEEKASVGEGSVVSASGASAGFSAVDGFCGFPILRKQYIIR